MQMDLIHGVTNPLEDSRRAWVFLSRDFPRFYVAAIEKLLYPDWHVACFVRDPTNASMWGAYGDGHKGVCLKFKAKPSPSGGAYLDLYRVNGWGSGSNGIVEHHDYVPHTFQGVLYGAEFPEIDFFESMAVLPRFKLDFWFGGINGERSTTAMRMLYENSEWRDEYWKKFEVMLRTKSFQWSHEDEYRLVLHSSMQRFDDVKARRLKYRFSDLSGIVFGIKTSHEDKLRIMKVIDKLCSTNQRDDFEFLQAYYSEKTKKIEMFSLDLIKTKPKT